MFSALKTKLDDWSKSSAHQPFHIYGITFDQWAFIGQHFLDSSESKQLYLFETDEIAEEALNFLQKNKFADKFNLLFFPGLDCNPYQKIVPSEKNFNLRFSTLSQLSMVTTKPHVVLCSVESLLLKIPSPAFFNKYTQEIKTDEIYDRGELTKTLINLGYSSAMTIEEPGTFSIKGEILDLYSYHSGPVRIIFFDDLVEHIYPIDTLTNRSLKDQSLSNIFFGPCGQIVKDESYRKTLRENVPQPALSFKNRIDTRKKIFDELTQGNLFDDYIHFFSQFFSQQSTLKDFISNEFTSYFVNYERTEGTFYDWKRELENSHKQLLDDVTSASVLPAPSILYELKLPEINFITLNSFQSANLEQDIKNSMSLKLEPIKPYFLRELGVVADKHLFLKKVFEHLQQVSHQAKIYFCCRSESSKSEISFLLENVPGKINHALFLDFINLDGFTYGPDNLFVISDSDLFSKKTEKTATTVKNIDLFAEQIGQLKIGDYVVHSEFGMAKYLGLETMTIGESNSDFLILQFDEGDKVYLPVYKLNLIQKHSDAINGQKLASLRLNKFNQVKERARLSAKELAFSLVELQAKRMTSKAFKFSPPDHLFNEFELSFSFQETPDQQKAIDLALDKMQSNQPMDLLVCGDVGFGKTEVAMRAAFKAVLDKKQVAVLVPTTILALQHFLTFTERFKDFPVNIDHISRFRTKKECDKIYADTKEHKIDILIGTHALLSSSIEYKDLGLVIVDEEHRFGVAHKEKLKLIKESVDFLTLTATPIPRTLQLSFLGLRDMALIQTAPPRRQSIKTYVIKEDPATIKEAIEKELHRGGQVYIVHNRVNDMEIFASKIRELVPQSKIIIGHGQLSEKDLEQRMKAFIQGEYNILIATTIIESGIDIPNANTMIVDRADTFGLAQLHQLRGRIGRSDKKAYAYLSVPAFQNIGVDAEKRLKALQTYADIGAGFSLASCDLEIRGAGDILGAEQSGHMEAVGLELYMQLIKDAINELKGAKTVSTKIDIEINTPYPAYIPSSYITDASTRLKQYKSLSNLETLELLDEAEEQYVDIYGAVPIEVTNLFVVLRARLLLSKLNVKSVQIARKSLILKFNSTALEQNAQLRNQIVDFFIKRPKVYQFTPDYKLIYSQEKDFDLEALLRFSKDIAQQLNLC